MSKKYIKVTRIVLLKTIIFKFRSVLLFLIVLKSGKVIIYNGDDYITINDEIYKINNVDSVREKADSITKVKFGI